MPIALFAKTRRLGMVAATSLLLIVVFEGFYTHSYSIPSFDYRWETPLSYLLGPFLGALCMVTVNSVTPDMEQLAVAPIRLWRTAVTVSLCAFQCLAIIGLRPVVNAFILESPITDDSLITLLLSTLTFQALAILSASMWADARAWAFPLLGLVMCVGFGFNSDSTPRPYHVLYTHTPASAIAAAILWLVAITVLASLSPATSGRRR
ncbi:MAG: hypothetical protein MR522_04800 [Trueperella sp.]|uniref:hypothetical protein n=1 Tax=Trueperella sp. TaxID=2699835 RepID=UPI0025D75CEF|nr:hypothetical protein [Trueperella sp.]MCI7305567.1 hypothetical protein [Trueperella sp.]MDY5403240.1 hypothetical protein [Trueperella sp.]